MIHRISILLFFVSLGFAEDAERYFISPSNDIGNQQLARAVLQGACEGAVKGDSCSQCPGLNQGPWSIKTIIVGHFASPQSEEAWVQVGAPCYYSLRANPVTLLLAKRKGRWTVLENVLAFDLAHCARKKFRSGREYLICEFYKSEQTGERGYELSSVTVEGSETKFHPLLSTSDTTEACMMDRCRETRVKSVEFRDVNNDSFEDISVTVVYGSSQRTEKLRDLCAAALEEGRIVHPPSIKLYRIVWLFDGDRYVATPESRPALALFHRDELESK